jgi:hypothetical protein
MRCLFIFGFALVTACSSTGATVKNDSGSQQNLQTTTTCPADISGWPYDAANSCFDKSGVMSNMCMTKPSAPNTTGLEAVCAADSNHQVYVIVVTTDASLSGTGWTFGARQAPNLVQDSAPLSSTDEATCASAMSAFKTLQPDPSALCSAKDGGI